MSKLKVHKIGDLCFDFKMGKDVGIDFYLKSEADKVIAELQKQVHDYAQGLYEIQAKAEKENAKLKARIAELEESGDAQRSNNG